MTDMARKLIAQVERAFKAEDAAKTMRQRSECAERTNQLLRIAWPVIEQELRRDERA